MSVEQDQSQAAGSPAAGAAVPGAPEHGRTARSRETIALYWGAAAQFPVRLAFALITPIFTVLLARFVGPYVISLLLTQVQAGTVTWESGWPLVAWYALSQVLGQVVGWRIALYAAWSFEVMAMKRLYQRVFDHLSGQSLGFHSDRFSGSLVSQTNKFTGAFEMFWDTIVWQVIPVLTTVVAAVTITAFILPWYSAFLFAMTLLFAGFVVLSARSMERLNVAEAQSSTRMTGFLADVMTNISAVKSAGAEATESASARLVAGEWRTNSLHVMRSFLGYSSGFSAVVAIMNTGAVLAAVVASEAQYLSVAAVYLATTYTLTVTDQLWEITQVMRNYNRVMGDAHDMVEILAIEPTVTDGDAQFQRGPGGVVFDRVTFTHEGEGEQALFDEFTLDIAPGEKIGLVGHSGSGKSTLTRLLLRFSDVDSGAVRVDGQDIREVTQPSLRSAIAYVAQEPLLFHRSITDNIAYGRPGATPEQVREAARKASADEFITKLPAGYQTMVGERGVKLSGGQRQRVAIARAVLKDASILVLDEATSALDSESEVHIQAALAHAMRGRTTIVIAHRLSTVQAMDRIVVLAEGRIVEQGSHAQLLAAGGVYAGLWTHQSGGFLE
ncbi:MAG: ABC transporter ATP-binding protein [Candidatus Nanopelagicales bacterium]